MTAVDISLRSYQTHSMYPESRKRGVVIQKDISKTTAKQEKKPSLTKQDSVENQLFYGYNTTEIMQVSITI